MPFDLAHDHAAGVRGERVAPGRVESVDGLDQPDLTRAHDVLIWFAAALVVRGQGLNHPQVPLRDLGTEPFAAAVAFR
jgi:hypothetical protein